MIDYVPYTDFHELNLDWIVKVVKEYVAKTDVLEINYADLKAYVDDYFADLDIQTEIDNKLQEMYDGGELAVLIGQFLSTESLLIFNTRAALKAADNLASGVSVMTLGTSSITDGLNEIYVIRSLTSSDTVDEVNIVSLTNYPALIAQLLPRKQKKTYIFIGDSYMDTEDMTQSIITYLPGYMDLDSNQYYWRANSGAAFGRSSNSFLSLIQDLESTIKYPYMITDIVCIGGHNDSYVTGEENILNAISAFKDYCATTYPNATVTLAFVGKNRDSGFSAQQNLNTALLAWQKCGQFGCRYIAGLENVNHDYSLFRDNLHPTAAGAQNMAKFIASGIENGSVSVLYNGTFELTPTGDVATVTGNMQETVQDSTAQVCINSTISITFNSAISPTGRIDIATATPNYILPYRYFATNTCFVRVFANNAWTFVMGIFDLQKDSATGSVTMHINIGSQVSNITQMQLYSGNVTMPSFLC